MKIPTPHSISILLHFRIHARKANTLIIWTDCDREGEHIGNEIVKVCCKENQTLKIFRAKFSEITKNAVERAMRTLTNIDRRIVNAIDCRMELDLRIGMDMK